MARGRMINRSISRDRIVADLANEVGGFGAMFYTWMISHLDRDGRVDGSPVVLKGLVAPRVDGCTIGIIEATLTAADRLGLIHWYDVNGDRYVVFPKFHKNQKGLRIEREPESEIPAPPRRQLGGSSAADCRQFGGSLADEGKGREGKGREGKGSRMEVEEKGSADAPRTERIGLPPIPLNVEPNEQPAPTWKPGRPLTCSTDLEQANAAWGWGTQFGSKERARAHRLYPIPDHEVAEHKPKADAKDSWRLAFFLGCVEKGREAGAREAAKPNAAAASRPEPRSSTWTEYKPEPESGA